MVAVDVFRKLRGAVETDLIHVGKVEKFDDASNELRTCGHRGGRLEPGAQAVGAVRGPPGVGRRTDAQGADLSELSPGPCARVCVKSSFVRFYHPLHAAAS